MFRFFPEEEQQQDDDGGVSTSSSAPPLTQQTLNQGKEFIIGDSHYALATALKSRAPCKVNLPCDLSLKCVNLGDLPTASKLVGGNDKVLGILESTSDLVPGVYEGGFKTWECTFDLIAYIFEHWEEVIKQKPDSSPMRILDLGCGSGFAGLAVLAMAEKRGVDIRVDFQDYNDEVIDFVTIPNVLLNFEDEVAAKCRFFSGDWDAFRNSMSADYDVVLSSETIYNLEYFPKFIRVVNEAIGGSGALYLAAKTFYFGVGGGTHAFLRMVGEGSSLNGKVVKTIKEGVQREVLLVQRTQDCSENTES